MESHSNTPRRSFVPQPSRRSLAALAGVLAFGGAASAQVTTFSVDWHSPSLAVPNSFTGTPITEADILAPVTLAPALGPLPAPGILETGGFLAPVGLGLGLYGPCVGHPANTPCGIEVDAISHAMDAPILPTTSGTTAAGKTYAFSVRPRGLGIPFSPVPPNVWSESPCQDEGADVFVDIGLPFSPAPPVAGGIGNTGIVDGNGLPSCSGAVYPGTGLIENSPGTPPGDNLDGLDTDVPDRVFPSTCCTYFSLDSGFIDPITGVPNSNSAAAHGVRGGDVLLTIPFGLPAVYAPANLLGLDLTPAGPNSDDLDALALYENGVPGYQRSFAPYDWVTGQTDMLLFSVRRGSAIIGMPDAFFGLPIEPGDILTPTGNVGSMPGIWVAAENLGLSTGRSTAAGIRDDLDALDTLEPAATGTPFCAGDGSGTACPCGNNGTAGRGCGNSAVAQGALLWANGTSSLSNDTVQLHVSGLPATSPMLFYQGTVPIFAGAVFGDGLRCVAGNVVRLGQRIAMCGNRNFGYGVGGDPTVSVAGGIGAPGNYVYQVWYRDGAAFCTPNVFNLSNGYRIAWTP